MDRFFLSPDQWNENPTLRGDEAHHCLKVMRKQVGDEIAIFDGNGREASARVCGFSKNETRLELIDTRNTSTVLPQLEVAVGVPKGKSFDLILQKAVEMGVNRIQPLVSIPICLFAYGVQGLGVASAIASVIILFHFTLGVFLAKKKFSLDVVVKSPPVYSIIISVIFLYFQIKTPLFIENTTFLLTYATIFLVLMSLGIALTRFKFSLKDSIILSLCRLILGPLIALIVIYNFDLSGFAAGVLLIQSAMPSAILNYLVGSMYSPKKVVESIASTIVVSTIGSFLTIPIIVFIALKYFS